MTTSSISLRIFGLFTAALLAGSASASDKKKQTYPFALEPEKALAALDKLEKLSGQKRPMSADEKALVGDVKDGRFVKWSMAEAALLADGVTDRDARKAYLKKYKTISDDAKKAIAGEATAAAKGKKLIETLHTGAMKGGYESEQTRLSELLDTGKFNCVSSSVLYNAVAFDPTALPPQGFSGSLQVYSVFTSHQEEAYKKGKAYLYFFPSGLAERANIQLQDGDDFFTIQVSSVAGRVKVFVSETTTLVKSLGCTNTGS